MTDKRVALIIANDQYQDDDLSQLIAPAQDAEALAQVLQDPDIGGFEVQTLLNELSYKVREEIEAFFDERQRDDLLLLYFSGHGVKDIAGRLYFATTDTRRRRLRSTGVSANFVNEVMRHSRSRQQVLLLDCCYSGAFARGMVVRTDKEVGTGEYFTRGRGQVVLTASDALQYAFEGDEVTGEGIRSVFTHTLVQGLASGQADLDGDGLISIEELYDYVYRQVTDRMPEQEPRKWVFDLQDKIIIARNPNPVVEPAELPAELQRDLQSPILWRREGTIRELRRLLQGNDKGLALAAQEALKRLIDDDSRRVSVAAAEVLRRVTDSPPAPVTPAELSAKLQQDRQSFSFLRRLSAAAAEALGFVTNPAPAPAPSIPEVLTISSPIQLELVLVPAGEFRMGSNPNIDKDARESEQPQHTVYLPDYYVAKTPLTNAQYAAFVRATGYREPAHWKQGKIPEGKTDHPVVSIGWADAVAFCRWLSQEIDQPFRPPTEVEWEKAARGMDGRLYPWGNQWDKTRLNSREGGVGDTTPVGRYSPQGDSPYGAVDMAGNVWEWCATKWGKSYPYDTSEDEWSLGYLKESADRVLRGGSWKDDMSFARCAARGSNDYHYSISVGVRVCVSPSR